MGLMPIILATWEVNIGRIMVRGQPRDPISTNGQVKWCLSDITNYAGKHR
jgi:hypothetical protein